MTSSSGENWLGLVGACFAAYQDGLAACLFVL